MDIVTSWGDSEFGYAGKSVLEKALIEATERQAEAIANIYLKNR